VECVEFLAGISCERFNKVQVVFRGSTGAQMDVYQQAITLSSAEKGMNEHHELLKRIFVRESIVSAVKRVSCVIPRGCCSECACTDGAQKLLYNGPFLRGTRSRV
jgi:hypothetical protein